MLKQFLACFTKVSQLSYPGPKYKKVSFSNPGHAFNLAERLNKIFETGGFTVVRLTQGVEVSEDEIKQIKE